MRLAKRSVAFNRMYVKNFYFNYLNSLVGCFIRKGYKFYAYNVISKFLYLVKLKYKIDLNILLNIVFFKYKPILSFLAKKVAASVYMLPWLINDTRAKYLLVRWFLSSSLSRTEPHMALRLFNEFNDLYLGYGRTIKKIEEFYMVAIKNRPFLRFLRKRRKVFLSRLKKYGVY